MLLVSDVFALSNKYKPSLHSLNFMMLSLLRCTIIAISFYLYNVTRSPGIDMTYLNEIMFSSEYGLYCAQMGKILNVPIVPYVRDL